MPADRLILASQSPRRRDLLARLAITAEVEPADIDETPLPGEDPDRYVERLARAKAAAVSRPGCLVVAADTAVVIDGAIVGKPIDRNDARQTLMAMSGASHTVLTGVAVSEYRTDEAEGTVSLHTVSGIERTVVWVAELTPARIDWYLATGEGDDKAGAYGLQGAAGLFADRVEGSVNNVIGLPLGLLDRLFAGLGRDLLSFAEPPA